jgi:hypothetical protein
MRRIALALILAAAACDTLDPRGAGRAVVEDSCDQRGACSAYCRARAPTPSPADCPATAAR